MGIKSFVHLVRLSAAALLFVSMPEPAPAAGPQTDWAGFYVGGGGGYAWGESEQFSTAVVAGSTGDYGISGGFIGGILGYNWQNQNWVFGFEVDLSASSIDGATSSTPTWNCTVTDGCQTAVKWFGTARGRLGHAFDAWLVYVTGGLAYGKINVQILNCGCNTDVMRAGPTMGAGVEHMFAQDWSVKLEYLHIHFGDFFFHTFNPGGIPGNAKANFNLMRVVLNRQF